MCSAHWKWTFSVWRKKSCSSLDVNSQSLQFKLKSFSLISSDSESSLFPSIWDILCLFLVWSFRPILLLEMKSHWSHFVLSMLLIPGSASKDSDCVPFSEVRGGVTVGVITGAMTVMVADTESVAAAFAAWWQAARCFFFSISAGPRWRGRWGRGAGKEGAEEEVGGREWGAPGWPMVQLNPMVVKPHLVVRLRDASPAMA